MKLVEAESSLASKQPDLLSSTGIGVEASLENFPIRRRTRVFESENFDFKL